MSSNNQLDDLWKKYEVTKEVLDAPNELTKHEDGKAGRILAPIAFITVAASTFFVALLNNNIKYDLYWAEGSLDLVLYFYFTFIFYITLGTILMLEGFGPNFNIPKKWKSKKPEPTINIDNTKTPTLDEPDSIYFFHKIIAVERDVWNNYFSKVQIEDLLKKACQDHVNEAHLIAQKVEDKILWIYSGKIFYYAAMIMLIGLVTIGTYAIAIR